MKKMFLLLFAALFIGAGCHSSNVQEPPLKLSAQSRYEIVCPDSAPNPGTLFFLEQVAKKLQTAFKQTIGAEFPVVKESKHNPQCKAIFLGRTQALRSLGVDPLQFKDFNYLIKVSNGNIYLAGSDRHRFGSTKKANSYSNYILGSAKAAVVFMEQFLETRFLMPGEIGTDYAKKSFVEVPGRLEIKGVPLLKMGFGRYPELFYAYANSNCGAGTCFTYGGHSYYTAVPAKKYAKSHPEYFALVSENGKRASNDNHLCISNKEVQDLIYQEVIAKLDAGAETVELAQTDAYMPCRCAKCKAYGNTDDPGEKVWILHRDIAERVRKARPGKKVLIICYPPNSEPPKTFDKFPDNVMIELCKYSEETFKAWSKIKVPQGFLVYIYNWGNYPRTGFTPKRTPEFCAEQARFFLKNHVKGIYRCGFGGNFGMEGPAYYVFGKVLENPANSTAQLVHEYCNRAFHEAAVPMQEFYNQLNDGVAIFSALQKSKSSDGEFRDPLPKSPRVLLCAIYPPERLDLLNKLLTRAEKIAKNPKARKRLSLVRFEFDYTRLLLNALHLYNAYRINPDQGNFEQLARAIETRNRFLDRCFAKNGRPHKIPGWREIPVFDNSGRKMAQVNGRLSAQIPTPLGWNTAILRKNHVLPGKNRKTMTIHRAKAQVCFGDFDKGAWAAAPWQTLTGIQLSSVSEQTKFKMLYDTQNLYIAVAAEADANRKYVPVGRDGAAWRQDALEVLLDPKGARENYYHLIWNPLPESCYDSACGFITDPRNPLFGKDDISWNGKWSYQTRREGKMWYSMATIPFATLKAKVEPGTLWTLNVGRGIAPENRGAKELALWSPSLEQMGFHDRDSFGEAVFE